MPERRAQDTDWLPPDVDGTVVTVGTFDGVHLGHRDVLDRLAVRARQAGLRSVLVTFSPHPAEVVRPDRAPFLLTVGDEKLEALADTGIDYCAVVPFTRELASKDAEAFVREVLRPRFRMRELLVGHDHGFGRDRAGGVEMLTAMGRREGFPVEVVPPVSFPDGEHVSSTAIRRAVAAGDLERASEGLGRAYSLLGDVVHGAGRGRGLGYPTVNLALPSPRKLLPPQGVYAVRVQTPRAAFGGMMNLGPRPTFGEQEVTLEAHLFDAHGEFYGERLRLEFVSRLRDVQRFASVEALRAQLARDDAAARRALEAAEGAPAARGG